MAEAMMALVLMDHALLYRAKNADVKTTTLKIAGSVKGPAATETRTPSSRRNPDPAEA